MALTLFALMELCRDEPKVFKRGEISYRDRHVQSFIYDREFHLMKGMVHASMKKTLYEVILYVSADGELVSSRSTCTCARGQHFCHHMVALGLHGINNISSTDSLCSWTQPKAAKEVQPISVLYPSKKFTALVNPLPDNFNQKCLEDLQSTSPSSGMCWLLEPEEVGFSPSTSPDNLVCPVEDIINDPTFKANENCKSSLIEMLVLTPEHITWVEEKTRGQQQNPQWFRYRKFRITASNFGYVLSACRRNRFPESLYKRLMQHYDLSRVKAVQWGNTHEKEAIKEYELLTGNCVLPVGLVLHASGCVGASPDGFVNNNRIVEVKCPYSILAKGLTHHIKSGTFYLHAVDDSTNTTELDISNKQGYDYYHQIQGNLHITGREICDLVVWTPGSSRIIQIKRDETWKTNLETLISFYKENFVNHLLPSI